MDREIEDFHGSIVEDPLFAAEGMDLDNAERAIEAIDAALSGLETEYARASLLRRLFFIRYPLAQHAVPLSFLRCFVACERQRRLYLASPSRALAESLVSSWERAVSEMGINLRHYRSLHRTLVRLESHEDTFVMQDMYGHRTTYRHAEGTIRVFEQNADALRAAIRDRRRLLAGLKYASAASSPMERTVPPARAGTIDPWHAIVHAAAVENGTWPYRYGDILETHGPYRVSVPNFNAAPTERTFLFYVLEDKNLQLKRVWPALVDQFFFQDTWHFSERADGVTRGAYASAVGLRKEEMPYWYEPATNLYNSRDCSYWMDLATIADMKRRPELNQALVAAERSSMWDMVLAECASDMRSLVAHLRRRERSETARSYSMLYDLLTRSYPGLYYLPFNKSVWRLREAPALIGDSFQAPRAGKMLEEERARTLLTPSVLKTVMSAARIREERGRSEGWFA